MKNSSSCTLHSNDAYQLAAAHPQQRPQQQEARQQVLRAASSAEETKAASGTHRSSYYPHTASAKISPKKRFTHRLRNEFSCEIVTETGGTNDRYTKLAADPNSTIDVIELSQATDSEGH